MKKSDRLRAFVREIFTWYAAHKRELPWRDLWSLNPRDRAYRVLVSEIMLQQTQVARVKIVFKNFLEQFPHIEDLARASNRDILLAWRGMGYNSRALRLRDAARTIVGRTADRRLRTADRGQRTKEFPSSMEELRAIPGIGHYTAAAIRNFAFGIATPCLDTNIRRILHRTFVGPENADGTFAMPDKELLKIAEELLQIVFPYPLTPSPGGGRGNTPQNSKQNNIHSHPPSGEGLGVGENRSAAEWHSALMDFGALVQTKKNPKWELCPLTQKGIMNTTKKNYELRIKNYEKKNSRPQEPGRVVGGKFTPNRIFRGRVVELLRDHPQGVSLPRIGKEVCIDWSKEIEPWLKNLITKLVRDSLVKREGKKFALAE